MRSRLIRLKIPAGIITITIDAVQIGFLSLSVNLTSLHTRRAKLRSSSANLRRGGLRRLAWQLSRTCSSAARENAVGARDYCALYHELVRGSNWQSAAPAKGFDGDASVLRVFERASAPPRFPATDTRLRVGVGPIFHALPGQGRCMDGCRADIDMGG